MSEALKITPEISSNEEESSEDQILTKKLEELNDKELYTLYDVIVNAIKKNTATLDTTQIVKKQNENLYSLDTHKKAKEITELNKSLTKIIHEMNKRAS